MKQKELVREKEIDKIILRIQSLDPSQITKKKIIDICDMFEERDFPKGPIERALKKRNGLIDFFDDIFLLIKTLQTIKLNLRDHYNDVDGVELDDFDYYLLDIPRSDQGLYKKLNPKLEVEELDGEKVSQVEVDQMEEESNTK